MGGGPARDLLLCTLPFPEPKDALDQLREKYPYMDVVFIEVQYTRDRNHLGHEVPEYLWKDVTVLCTYFTFPKVVADAPNLEFVHLVSAGSNQVQHEPLYTDSEIPITTSSGIHGPQIAEWAIMTRLVASHKYNQLYELQKKHQWGKTGLDDDYHHVFDLVGQRLGVLGYGSIGRQIGRVAKSLGMEVLAYTATPKDTKEKRKDHGIVVPGTGDPNGEIPKEWFSGLEKEKLRHFLRQDLDWLVVSVPLTDKTHHLLSRGEFEALSQKGKRPVFVTNIARGQIIDQPKLVEALNDGTLAGAALDVTDPEPLPKDSELWDMKNVIVTPHISGVGESYLGRAIQVLETNLERRKKGEKLINEVNRERGY